MNKPVCLGVQVRPIDFDCNAMALATSLQLEGFDFGTNDFNGVIINKQHLKLVYGSLLAHTLRAIDPRLSDGETWVDFVAITIIQKPSLGEHASATVIIGLLRAHLFPQSAEKQTEYALLTHQFESDLMWAAMLRQAIATIFWAHVAQKGSAYVLAEIDDSVTAAISKMTPFSWRKDELIEISKKVTKHLDTRYSLDPDISPEKIFRVALREI